MCQALRSSSVFLLLLLMVVFGLGAGCKKQAPDSPSDTSETTSDAPSDDANAPLEDAQDTESVEGATQPEVTSPLLTSLSLTEALAANGRAAQRDILVRVPSGAAAEARLGRVVIRRADDFALEVVQGEVDIAAYRTTISDNPINILQRFVIDEPNTLVYESEALEQKQVHFVATLKVGDESYSCEDVKGVVFEQAQVDLMLAACRSLEAK